MSDPSPDTPNVAERTHPLLDGRPVMIGDVLVAPHPDDPDPEGNTLKVEFHVGSMFWDSGHDVDYSTGKPVWPSRPRGWTVAPIDEEANYEPPYEWPLSECRRPDTPSVCPTCGSDKRSYFLDPCNRGDVSADRWHYPQITDEALRAMNAAEYPNSETYPPLPATPAAAGSSSPDVTALAERLRAIADSPWKFLSGERGWTAGRCALAADALEALVARNTELEAAIRKHRSHCLPTTQANPGPADGALWALLDDE